MSSSRSRRDKTGNFRDGLLARQRGQVGAATRRIGLSLMWNDNASSEVSSGLVILQHLNGPTLREGSIVFRGFLPAALPPATTRGRGCLGGVTTIRQQSLGVSRDPDVGQKRFQIHHSRGQGRQQRTHIRQRFDSMTLGFGQDRETDRRRLASLVAAEEQPIFPADRAQP